MPRRSIDAAGEQEADRIRQLERKHDVAVIDLAPAELRLQCRLENPDHLAIDVVDRRGEKQQAADHPPERADAPGRSLIGCSVRRFGIAIVSPDPVRVSVAV